MRCVFLLTIVYAGITISCAQPPGNHSSSASPLNWQDRPISLQEVRFPALAQAVNELKGQVVVIDFWATWCEPCVKKFPRLVNLQKKYGDRGLVCVSVSQDGRGDPDYGRKKDQVIAKVKEFLERQDARFPNFLLADFDADDAQLQQRFRLGNDIPFLVVLDREGVPVWNSDDDVKDPKNEDAELDRFLDKLLAS